MKCFLIFQQKCHPVSPAMSLTFKLLTIVFSRRCWFYRPHLAHTLATSSELKFINKIDCLKDTNQFFFSLLCPFSLLFAFNWCAQIRRRKDKTEKNRTPIQNDVSKKPVSDFGSKALNEYLLGSRKMKPFPVAMSLVARYLVFDIFRWYSISSIDCTESKKASND